MQAPASFNAFFAQLKKIIDESREQLTYLEESRRTDEKFIARRRAALEKVESELRLIRAIDLSAPLPKV